MMSRIADKVSVECIEFHKNTKLHKDKATVSLAKSNGILHFNPKMVKLLNMKDWKQVLVGYDKSTQIIVLKNCDAEEYGSVVVRTPNPIKIKGFSTEAAINRSKGTRDVSINHLLKSIGIKDQRMFRAERNGVMVFLESLSEED